MQNISGAAQPNPYMKIFGKAQVDVNLSLGQLLKNLMFEEAEPEFQQFAFFKTRIGKMTWISFLAMQVIFICVYITKHLHFFTVFLSFYTLKL